MSITGCYYLFSAYKFGFDEYNIRLEKLGGRSKFRKDSGDYCFKDGRDMLRCFFVKPRAPRGKVRSNPHQDIRLLQALGLPTEMRAFQLKI